MKMRSTMCFGMMAQAAISAVLGLTGLIDLRWQQQMAAFVLYIPILVILIRFEDKEDE